MGRVLTNNVSLAYVAETAVGIPATSGWKTVEPNAITQFGANITTVARTPISRNRQNRKGTVTDLDSAIEFDSDLTLSAFRDFVEGFVFAKAVNRDVTELAVTAVSTTDDSYTVTALTAAQSPKLEIGTLLWAEGFTNAANNGLKYVDADIATSATKIMVSQNLSNEASPPSGARVSVCGYQLASTDSGKSWTWSSTNKTATLAGITGIGTKLKALGLTVGQFVHIGSIPTADATSISMGLGNAAANDMYGFARVVSISADNVVFDKLDTKLQQSDTQSGSLAVNILFGEFIRNVPTSDTEFLEQTYQFEAGFPNLGSGGADEYQYSKGNYCNTLSFSLPLTDKATSSFGFVGTDTENPSTSRKTGASAAADPFYTAAMNTSSDIARLRIADTDEDGLTTDFKSLTLTLNNNVTPEKVIGTLGSKFVNAGNFDVAAEAQLVFTNSDVISRIRENTTVAMDFVVKNSDGVITVDIPSMTLGGGDREFPVNESVLINTTGQAFQDDKLLTSVGVSILRVPLP